MKILVLVAPVLLAAAASAQNFNVRFGAGFPVPSSTFGAVAAQPGVWNGVWASGPSHTLPLVDLSGASTGVSITDVDFFFDATFDHPGTIGDVGLLLDIFAYPASCCGHYRIDGLQAGEYEVFTYAWAPDVSTFRSGVEVLGSIDPLQVVGGPWPGGFVLGATHAFHRLHVDVGGSLTLYLTAVVDYATLNGVQIVRRDTSSAFCIGDGTGAPCPCANNGAAGQGCANSTGQGAVLAGSGFPDVSSDAFALEVSGMPSSTTLLFFQGDAQLNGGLGVPFGDGLRCAGGTVIRLGTKTASGGAARYPEAGDALISVRGAIPGTGGARFYQAWYRNAAAFCTPNTFNLSNGLATMWVP